MSNLWLPRDHRNQESSQNRLEILGAYSTCTPLTHSVSVLTPST